MEVICVTGTPATGKTTLSKKLAKRLNYYYLNVNRVISKYKLSEGYDKKGRTKIVDIRKLIRFLTMQIKDFKKIRKYSGMIIDSHLSHYLPRKYVDFCIVTKCDIKVLNKRLKKKGYHKAKIQENLQSEIFDICMNEAKERRHNIIAVDTTKGFNIEVIAREIGG